MNRDECIKFAIDAVQNLQGDNLYRAKMHFRNLSPEEMKKQYGESGKSCQEILDGYREHFDKCEKVIAWLKSL